MLCTFPSAKPLVSIWFIPLGLAPLSLRLFAWSFRVSSHAIWGWGRKLSDCSIAGFLVRFQPAVVNYCAGGLNLEQMDPSSTPKVPNRNKGWSLSLSTMLRSMQDSWWYEVPTMLLSSLKLIGFQSIPQFARRPAEPGYWQIWAKVGDSILANCLRNGFSRTGWPGYDTHRVQGLDTNWAGAHPLLVDLSWTLPWSGRWPGRWWVNGLHALYSCLPREIGQGKAIRGLLFPLMTNGRSLCSRGHELVLNRAPSLPCLPSQGRPLSWFQSVPAHKKPTENVQMA